MTSQERIQALLAHREPDRIGRYDHFWWQALDRFRSQGMPEDADPEDYFDYDIRKLKADQSFQLPTIRIEEAPEFVVDVTEWGITQKTWTHSQSTPEFLDFSCRSKAQWYDEFRPLKQPNSSRLRLDEMKSAYQGARSRGKFFCMSCLEVFEATWRVCGPQMQLELLVEDPQWLMDMYAVDTELCIWAFEELFAAGIEFDGLWVWGDIAYRSGPFMSPRMYREIVMPHHRRLFDAAHARGCSVIYHGCGNNNAVVPDLIEAGVDCLQPLEVKAGMDVRELKRNYGDRLSFMGNIDARLLAGNDRDSLERELREKITAAKAGGGYIYHSDHSVPPDTDLDTYRFVMECVERFGSY